VITMRGIPLEAERCPRILVIAADPRLREFCRDGLPWAGCITEYADDISDAITGDFLPDVIVLDLPANGTHAEQLRHLREYADDVGSRVIALTDDLDLIIQGPAGVQVLFRPCPAELLWDALAVAVDDRN
jgi:hypothetical protein